MFPRIIFIHLFFCLVNLYPGTLHAQDKNATSSPGIKKKKTFLSDKLFNNDAVLQIKLTGKLNELFNNRKDNIVYHPMLLQYKEKDSSLISIQLKMQARGNFRRRKENCTMPPLMMNFPKSKTRNTIFENQNKLKLVVPCRGDEYVIQEWLVYKLYNLITEKSFRARLLQVEFEDSLKKRKTETHYCILLEDEKSVAERNKAIVSNRTMVPMLSTDRDQFLKMAVFQFMIGNTDWSVPYAQNIKLLAKDPAKAPYTIPYDFDHAGIVSAPYALPAEELEMSSVVERRYRGYCLTDKNNFAEVFTLFNKLKDNFYSVYTNCTLLNAKYVKFVTKYLDDFYKIINNDKTIENDFGKPCKEDVRIEIQGLKER